MHRDPTAPESVWDNFEQDWEEDYLKNNYKKEQTTMDRKPTVHTLLGDLTMTRDDQAREFVCGRCNTPKKAKNTAQWCKNDGETVTICNGCYGNILSRE